MKKIILLACLAILPNSAWALDQSDLLGKWYCYDPEETVDGLTIAMAANVEFKENGQFRATMKLIFKDSELEATALVKYRSNWTLRDGYLDDRPTSAVVRSLKANGRDLRDSSFAKDIKADLMKYSPNNKAKVAFVSDTKMSLKSKNTTIHCKR